MSGYLVAAGHNVHEGQLIAFLGQRARVADLGVTVVPSSSGAGWDVVLRLGGPYWDRLAAESAASTMRNLTNLPAIAPADPTDSDEAPATPAASTTTNQEK